MKDEKIKKLVFKLLDPEKNFLELLPGFSRKLYYCIKPFCYLAKGKYKSSLKSILL